MNTRLKKQAKSIGRTHGPIGWPESEERIDLRKLRIKLIETKDAVENEIPNQGADIGQFLELIQAGLEDGIAYLNDIMGLDKNGNNKPTIKYQTTINEAGEIIKSKIKL